MTRPTDQRGVGYAPNPSFRRMVDIKRPDFASGAGRVKKAEAAAYAEAQTKGSAWLPCPIRPAKVAVAVADRLSVDDESDDEAEAVDDADDADTMHFPRRLK